MVSRKPPKCNVKSILYKKQYSVHKEKEFVSNCSSISSLCVPKTKVKFKNENLFGSFSFDFDCIFGFVCFAWSQRQKDLFDFVSKGLFFCSKQQQRFPQINVCDFVFLFHFAFLIIERSYLASLNDRLRIGFVSFLVASKLPPCWWRLVWLGQCRFLLLNAQFHTQNRHFGLNSSPADILELDPLFKAAKKAGVGDQFPRILVDHAKKEVIFCYLYVCFKCKCLYLNLWII